jgi:hypothetical protein
MAFFSKNSVVINFFAKTSSSKNRGYFHNFFGKNIFRIILSVHGLSSMQVSFRRKVIINANNSDHSSIVFHILYGTTYLIIFQENTNKFDKKRPLL